MIAGICFQTYDHVYVYQYMITNIWLHTYDLLVYDAHICVHIYECTYMITHIWVHVYEYFQCRYRLYTHMCTGIWSHICVFRIHIYDLAQWPYVCRHMIIYSRIWFARIWSIYMYMISIYEYTRIWYPYMSMFSLVMLDPTSGHSILYKYKLRTYNAGINYNI